MTCRRGKFVFARFLGVLAAVALLSAPLAAQQTTGKLEGTVTDQAGTAIANAQVLVVGTSYGTVTNDKGYYFVNNIPVGTYAVRAQFIGYAPAEVRGVRLLGGQTVTADLKLESSAIQITAVTVTGYQNAIVPRDQVTSKSIISGDLVNSLPVDDVRAIIAVQPGVVESGSGLGLSIRGSRPGQAQIYVDGAPVRSGLGNADTRTSITGTVASLSNRNLVDNPGIDVGTNAVEEASVTTGAVGVEFADAQAGVISYTTRAGGDHLTGSLGYETDEPFGDAVSVGLNRFEGSLGGPVPSVKNLTFFLSGTVQGQMSDFRGWGSDRTAPRYVMGGIDTTVTWNDSGTTRAVTIPQFVQYSGTCPSGSDTGNEVRDAMLNNYGVECQGRRLPLNWSSDMKFGAKLQYSYGDGSRVFLSGSANGSQGRLAPGSYINAPALFAGYHNFSRFGAIDMNHVFNKSAERALSLNVNGSWQRDGQLVGPLDPTYEAATRSPFMGIEWGTVAFAGLDRMPFPLTQEIVDNIRSNNQTGLRTPFLNRGDLGNTQESRINPYGMETGWVQSGFDVAATMYQETRMSGRATADWQMNRYNRFQFGGDIVKTDISYWGAALIDQSFMDAYVVKPVKYGLYGADRLDLGDVVLELGLRYDYYNANALFPTTPGRVYSHPDFNQGASASNPDSLAASVARVFTPSVGHSAISPRLRVAFPVTENTSFRMSYSHQVQSPDYNTLFTGINSDFDFTNTNDVFGRDLQFGKTIQFEFGVRHAFNQDMVLDVAAYNKDNVGELAARILPFLDPLVGDTSYVNVLTNSDFGNVRGIDFRLDRRVGNYVNAAVGYTFQLSRSTGSDPLSYLRTFSRQISQVTGERVPPPQAILPTDDNRAHNIVGSLGVNLPPDWRKGTTAGAIFHNLSVFATFRIQSGLPYTRLKPDGGTGLRAPRTNFGLVGTTAEPLNASTLPWQKNVNLRLNKGFKIGSQDISVFADIRNLLNFKNVEQLFAETGDVVNAKYREVTLSTEYVNLRREADDNGRLNANNDINLVPSCNSWTVTGGSTGPVVNCVMLRRTEARFGNGDGLYTVAEQERALNAYYDAFSGPAQFYGDPRHIRIGFELNLR